MEAEVLRLRLQLRRNLNRVIYGAVAAVFLIFVLAFLHVALWSWLAGHMAGGWASLVVCAVDLVITGILGALALFSSPGQAETEALAVRRQALNDAAGSLTVMALLPRVMEYVVASRFAKGRSRG